MCTSRGAANLYVLSDNIVFQEDKELDLRIDEENLAIIELGIQRELLFPISWFRIDLGIKSLETLELWDKIKDNPKLRKALERYEKYVTSLVYKKFQYLASTEKIGTDIAEDFSELSPAERRKALRDMAEAIRKLADEYKK